MVSSVKVNPVKAAAAEWIIRDEAELHAAGQWEQGEKLGERPTGFPGT